MAENTGDNFRPEVALEMGGSTEINGEKLSRAWLNGQNEMVAPLADLLSSLVESGQLKKDTLAEALQKAREPAWRATEIPENQVVRNVSERFIELMVVRLAGGKVEEAKDMLGHAPIRSSYDADMQFLANFVTKEARLPVKK